MIRSRLLAGALLRRSFGDESATRSRAQGGGLMAKVANASLDALDARALSEDLPGVQVAFDRAAMRGHLQSALIGPRSC